MRRKRDGFQQRSSEQAMPVLLGRKAQLGCRESERCVFDGAEGASAQVPGVVRALNLRSVRMFGGLPDVERLRQGLAGLPMEHCVICGSCCLDWSLGFGRKIRFLQKSETLSGMIRFNPMVSTMGFISLAREATISHVIFVQCVLWAPKINFPLIVVFSFGFDVFVLTIRSPQTNEHSPNRLV